MYLATNSTVTAPANIAEHRTMPSGYAALCP
jgi:hypothetical protein